MLPYNHEKSNDSLRFGDDLDCRMRRPRRPGSYENRPMSRSLGREELLRLRSRTPLEVYFVAPYQDFARIGLDPPSDSRQRAFLFAAPRRTRTAFSRTGRDAAGRRNVIRIRTDRFPYFLLPSRLPERAVFSACAFFLISRQDPKIRPEYQKSVSCPLHLEALPFTRISNKKAGGSP